MDKTAEQLFNYLRDVLYDPENAMLDPDTLPEDFLTLGQGLVYLSRCINETRELARALSRGNLSVKLPPPDNELAAPLKALHASLKHMTWQSQQVAKGDYQQRIEFMGEFADAFNTMIEQLDHRQKALEAEIESGHRKTLALEQSNSLFEAITERITQWIIVMERQDGHLLFKNKVADTALAQDPNLPGILHRWMDEHAADIDEAGMVRDGELELPADSTARYLSVTAYPLRWREQSAVAFVLSDISAEKQHMQQLESYAYQDNLTKVHNRFYGMETLRQWLEENRAFCICFADLDNLKYVNDTFGHSEGDVYIIAAATLMLEMLPGAMVCRLGGDEFMIMMEGCKQEDGEQSMLRIRSALMNSNSDGPRVYQRSISYGVVQVDDDSLTASELLTLADERMYRYKRAHKKARKVEKPPAG